MKKIFKSSLVALIVLGSFSGISSLAAKPNTDDTRFTFQFGKKGGFDMTTYRNKFTASYMYAIPTVTGNHLIYGVGRKNGTSGAAVDRSKGYNYGVYKANAPSLLTQWVYENRTKGKNVAHAAIGAKSSSTDWSGGWWSPDYRK